MKKRIRLTERQLRNIICKVINEATEGGDTAFQFQDLVGKYYHQIYNDDNSTSKANYTICLPITDVCELDSGLIGLILGNKEQANFYPEQLESIVDGTYENPLQNMEIFIDDYNHWDVGKNEKFEEVSTNESLARKVTESIIRKLRRA